MNNLSAVESIFFAALDKGSPEERAAYLDEACSQDPTMRASVERMLGAHPRVGNFLQAPAPGLAGTVDEPPIAEQPGSIIGPYKLMEQIGEGGMGLVFVAEQQQPIRRKVALKIIKPGMDTRQVIARFEAERQALALMDHPNIAKVLDAGTTESGLPYFVMELVKGVPITDYCVQNQLAPRERLGLFAHVCLAVQHAHQKGIIHRDLKPSNVLVTLHDGTPVVKVIDFGVAKAVGQQLTEKTIYTRFAQMVGTPLYMSPEQAAMSGLDIDTRSDIFSLGVLLYELLTGTTPFDRERFGKAAFDEIRRIIREEEPPKPSTRLNTLGQTISAMSATQKADARKLSALVKGDLDWIVMKALEKDRSRRYETASAFAADVRRFLSEEPIDARPPSTWYRFRKLARRNKVVLTTVTLVAGALIVGTAAATWQAVRATRSETAATKERDGARAAERKAKAEKENTQAALDFLWQDVLAQASPIHQPDPDLKVRALLDRVDERLEKGSGQPPLVEAAVRRMVGELYSDLGATTKAGHHLKRALDVQRRELGEEDVQTLATMHSLGVYYQRQNKSGEARAILGLTLELRRRVLGEEDHDTLVTMRWLGMCTPNEDSFRLLRECLEIRTRKFGEKHRETLYTMLFLAGYLARASEFGEAETLGARCLDLSRQAFGEGDYLTISAMSRLALTYTFHDDGARAEPLAREALKGFRRIAGDQHPATRGSMRMLAQAYQMQDKYAEAAPLIAELLAQQRTDSDFVSILALELRGRDLLMREKNYAEAEQPLRECLALYENRSSLPRGPFVLTQILLGASMLSQKKYEKAETLLVQGYKSIVPGYRGLNERKEGQAGTRTLMPLDKRHQIEALGWLVRLYEEWNKPDEAAKWRKELEEKMAAAIPGAGR